MLGFILDFIEICYVFVPLVAPPLLMMGFDPVWLGIMLAINLQTSFLTPPFGFSLFYLRGVTDKSIRTIEIYKGVIPFIAIQLLVLLMVILFPSLSLMRILFFTYFFYLFLCSQDEIVTDKTFTIFEDQKILFDAGLINNDTEIIRTLGSGRVVLKKIELPETDNFHRAKAIITLKSTGDPWDKSGSFFLLPKADFDNLKEETKKIIMWGSDEEISFKDLSTNKIVKERNKRKINTTLELAEIIRAIVPKNFKKDPATKTFQAIRIAVNNELQDLSKALVFAEKIVRKGGVIAVVTFHSIEDKIVKDFGKIMSGKASPTNRYSPPTSKTYPSLIPIIKNQWLLRLMNSIEIRERGLQNLELLKKFQIARQEFWEQWNFHKLI